MDAVVDVIGEVAAVAAVEKIPNPFGRAFRCREHLREGNRPSCLGIREGAAGAVGPAGAGAKVEGKDGSAADRSADVGLSRIGAGNGLHFRQGHDDLLFVWGGRGEDWAGEGWQLARTRSGSGQVVIRADIAAGNLHGVSAGPIETSEHPTP